MTQKLALEAQSLHFELLLARQPDDWARISIAKAYIKLQQSGVHLPQPYHKWPLLEHATQKSTSRQRQTSEVPAGKTDRSFELVVGRERIALSDLIQVQPFSGQYLTLRCKDGRLLNYTSIGSRYIYLPEIPIEIDQGGYLVIRYRSGHAIHSKLVDSSTVHLVAKGRGDHAG